MNLKGREGVKSERLGMNAVKKVEESDGRSRRDLSPYATYGTGAESLGKHLGHTRKWRSWEKRENVICSSEPMNRCQISAPLEEETTASPSAKGHAYRPMGLRPFYTFSWVSTGRRVMPYASSATGAPGRKQRCMLARLGITPQALTYLVAWGW